MAKTNTKKSPFSTKFLKEIKGTLLSEKERLEKDLGIFAKKDPEALGGYYSAFPNYGDKDDENAAEVADYVVRKSLENTLEKNLRDVIQSLKRLDDKDYGICKYCEKPIPEKRLMARPDSSACAACKKTIKQEV